MCGRYTLFAPQADLEDRFGVAFERPPTARYNCAPGQALPVVTDAEPGTASYLTWGLTPSWADDDSTSFVNARAETVAEKPSFREAFRRRRCLVLADGFYEWSAHEGEKRPYRVAFEDDRPFAMAGIWERWTPPATQPGLDQFGAGTPDAELAVVESFAVVTTEPNEVVAPLHDRMAVVLDPDEEETWLGAGPDRAHDLLDPAPADEMHAYPVSTRVNSPANDAPDLVDPVDG